MPLFIQTLQSSRVGIRGIMLNSVCTCIMLTTVHHLEQKNEDVIIVSNSIIVCFKQSSVSGQVFVSFIHVFV